MLKLVQNVISEKVLIFTTSISLSVFQDVLLILFSYCNQPSELSIIKLTISLGLIINRMHGNEKLIK